MTEHHDHDDVRAALHRVTPELSVPDGLLAGAVRRRNRTRGLMGGGAAALALVMVVPLAMSLVRGGSMMADSAGAPGPVDGLAAGESPAHDAGAEAAPIAPPVASDPADGPAEEGAPEAQAAQPSSAARISEHLGWQAILASEGANRVVSPSSLTMSLAQVAEGAEGASLASIDVVLGLTGDARAAAFAALRESLMKYDSLPASVDANDPPESPVVHQASRVLAIDAAIKQPFLDRIAQFYDAKAEATSLADAKANLDAWAKLHTAGLIDKSGIDPEPGMVAVLQDALLFAAAWEEPFTKELDLDFATPDGTKLLAGVSETLQTRFAEGERWTAVRLPYDDQLAADVILPKPGVVPTDLTAGELAVAAEALAAATPEAVTVSMPTFDLHVRTDLMAALPQIDLQNLSGIHDGAFAGEWVQQAKLIVTARGTVGAALTEVAVFTSGGAVGRPFTVDRPYIFRVLDTHTNWPLFLAAISDPNEE